MGWGTIVGLGEGVGSEIRAAVGWGTIVGLGEGVGTEIGAAVGWGTIVGWDVGVKLTLSVGDGMLAATGAVLKDPVFVNPIISKNASVQDARNTMICQFFIIFSLPQCHSFFSFVRFASRAYLRFCFTVRIPKMIALFGKTAVQLSYNT